MSHQVPTGEIVPVLKSALKFFVGHLEKQKFAATSRPGNSRRGIAARHIPAAVKRAVWERDRGQCAFVSGTGQRCPARTRLEFHHNEPVARGGEATVEGIRLRCRAHNQYEAECAFGAGFMSDKRAEAQARAAAEQDDERDVVPWLMRLGFRVGEARRAAARCETIPYASLEGRLRLALSFLAPPRRRAEASLGTAT